jgi:murein DD-endopeptidase MepM/ murein hydrolase activator NlpD
MRSPFKERIRVTQTYLNTNPAYSSGKHKGLDLVPMGDDRYVYATVNGEVSYAGWENPNNHKQGFGQYVSILVCDKKHYFCHLAEIYVKAGQAVKEGDRIGLVGSTGNSTGTHLHYEIRLANDKNVTFDPAEHIGIKNEVGIYDVIKQTVDNTPSKWAETAVSKAIKNGIIKGDERGNLKLHSPITKEELMVILDRLKLL